MAQDEERPTAAEKGKGKVDDINGEKGKGRTAPEKDGKPTVNGKVVEGLPEGKYIIIAFETEASQSSKADILQPDELNEEDAQLKSELEMLVERLQVSLYRAHDVMCKRSC